MGGCPTGEFPGSCHRGRRKRGLQTDLHNEIVQEIETLLGYPSITDLDLEAVEMAVRRQALRLAARALEQRLNMDTRDHEGPELPCPCGGSAKYHGRHGKTFASVLGPLHLQRAYYHCEQCASGFCPRDRALGLESFSLTPGVLRMTASAAALLSFTDGTAKTREAKLVTIWTAESRDEKGKPVRDSGSVTYSAAIESAATLDTSPDLSDFGVRVQREANRRGFPEAQRQAVLGDGSPWIWNTASELFPQAAQILDRFHAKEHLSQVGKVIYGDSLEGKQWIQTRYDDLDEGRLKSLVEALHGHAQQYKGAGECIHYIWNNRRRMRYPKFHQQGLCTSTGVVEAGCKLVIGTRLKRAGMHWTVKGANTIIALRCSKLSGRFEDFWERRSDQMKGAA